MNPPRTTAAIRTNTVLLIVTELAVIAKKPAPPLYPGYLSPAQQRQQALHIVNAALAPGISANKAAQKQATIDAANHAAAIQGFYGAAAEGNKSVGTAIDKTYGAASERQAAFGKGYSDALQRLQGQTADQSNALLAQNNSPQHFTPGTGAADALYATGGLAPASVLNNAGSAFSAAAANLPAQDRNIGAQGATSAVFQGADAKHKLQTDLLTEFAKRPSLLDQALQSLRGEQQQNYANWIQANYLDNTLRKTGAGITGVDPVTGKPAAGYTADKNGNVVPISMVEKKNEKRAAAVKARDDATSKTLADTMGWVEAQVNPTGTTQQVIAHVPIVMPYKTAPIKDAKGHIIVEAKTVFSKKGGGTTTDVNQAQYKAITEQTPVAKPEFYKLLRQVTSKLSVQLRRYGWRPAQIRAMAMDIVDDHYVLTSDVPPLPAKKRRSTTKKGSTTTHTESTGP